MTESVRYDIAVVGGGIVGTAAAMALSERPGLSLILLEAEEKLASHQTGHNSGVIHSGLYYKPGSLKAGNCVEGRKALYRFCMENDIPHDRCGKVVVATRESELPALDELERRGHDNGLEGLERLGPEEIREHEPHVHGIAGLLVPETGIVDFAAVTEAYAAKVREAGGEIRTGSKVVKVVRDRGDLLVETANGTVRSRNLINCGGLQCDRVARMCGVDPGMRVIPFRGEYYRLAGNRAFLVKNLVYPVPDPRFPFLGVHFTRMVHGGIEAGPNAVLSFEREGYGPGSFALRDFVDIVTYPGFWRMASVYWRMGLGEFRRSFSKQAFVKALQRLLPEIEPGDVYPAGAGVRAQALAPDGRLLDDFRVVEGERMIHVLNAPSPAATASISIGRAVAGMAADKFDLD